MLYGMEDYEEEFGLVKQEKLNIKKVAIIVAIIVVLFIIVISFAANGKNSDNTKQQLSRVTVEPKEQLAIQEEKKEENNPKENVVELVTERTNKNDGEYIGTHMKIAEHKIDESTLPVFNENGPEIIKNLYTSEQKEVYLTFDDGPSKDITPQVLDILKAENVKATFFVLGARVELYPDTLKRELSEGHYIANHGYSHSYSTIYANKDMVFEEFRKTEECIKSALGNQDYNSYLFRFPGGSSGGRYEKVKAQARNMFREYGIAFTNWNCLTGDAAGSNTKEACIQQMIETRFTPGNRNTIVLLMHDANDKAQTVEALPEVIKYFKDEGYEFKNFYEVFK